MTGVRERARPRVLPEALLIACSGRLPCHACLTGCSTENGASSDLFVAAETFAISVSAATFEKPVTSLTKLTRETAINFA